MPEKISVQQTVYRFEWDEDKNRQNVRKHGFGLADAEEMFGGIFLFCPTCERTTEKAAGLELVRFVAALRLWPSLNVDQIQFVSFR